MMEVLSYFNALTQGTFLDVIFWMWLSHQIVCMHGRVWLLHYLFLRESVVGEWGMVNPSKFT